MVRVAALLRQAATPGPQAWVKASCPRRCCGCLAEQPAEGWACISSCSTRLMYQTASVPLSAARPVRRPLLCACGGGNRDGHCIRRRRSAGPAGLPLVSAAQRFYSLLAGDLRCQASAAGCAREGAQRAGFMPKPADLSSYAALSLLPSACCAAGSCASTCSLEALFSDGRGEPTSNSGGLGLAAPCRRAPRPGLQAGSLLQHLQSASAGPRRPCPPTCVVWVWAVFLGCRIDEAEYDDPEKVQQSPLAFEGFAPSVSFFVVGAAAPSRPCPRP